MYALLHLCKLLFTIVVLLDNGTLRAERWRSLHITQTFGCICCFVQCARYSVSCALTSCVQSLTIAINSRLCMHCMTRIAPQQFASCCTYLRGTGGRRAEWYVPAAWLITFRDVTSDWHETCALWRHLSTATWAVCLSSRRCYGRDNVYGLSHALSLATHLRTRPAKILFFFRRAPQQMLRTHRSLKAYCANLWWRWSVFFFIFPSHSAPVEWNWEGKTEVLGGEKTCPSATLSTTNPAWTDLGSNPGLRG